MEELSPQELEELVQELEGESGAPDSTPRKVRVCPECGKQNLENAWHCVDCGTTLSVQTLMDVEDGQPSMAPIPSQRALSSLSPHFKQDAAELLGTVLQDDDSVVWGCNITQISSAPPFRFGYLLVTSRRLIRVEFESEVTRDAVGAVLKVLQIPFTDFVEWAWAAAEALRHNERPKRGWAGGSSPVPAVSYPNYPLTPNELASRTEAVYDLESLVSADLESALFGDTHVVSLTARFHQDRKATCTFYTLHEALQVHELLAPWL